MKVFIINYLKRILRFTKNVDKFEGKNDKIEHVLCY